MKKKLYLIYQPYKFIIYAPLMAILTCMFASVAVILAFFCPRVASFIGGACWARTIAFITPMWVKVRGQENITPGKPYIIAVNHQSVYDIFVLYGWLDLDFKWIMKKEIRKIPFIGLSCELIGHIFIDRKNKTAAMESINSAKKQVASGASITFFPEGTRSTDGKLQKFKPGAFKLARDLKLPVLPVTIRGTRKILPSKSLDLRPGTAEMIIHKPIGPDKNDRLLKDKTREIISAELNNRTC
jgi:1-acyl-sn-glycerol-3-phosphate acyltransferase